jgi:hypothetical protein
MQIESFSTQPLQEIINAYLYAEYADDESLQGFIDSYNSLSQGYLQWFNETPLSVYTSPNISGALLDWIGQGIYGIPRPVISTVTSTASGPYNTAPYDVVPYGGRKVQSSGSVTVVNDDIYKRVLTWHLYLGDGRQMSVQWLRRRVARFIFGANGADIPADDFQQISITRPSSGYGSSYGNLIYNAQAYDTRSNKKNLTRKSIEIGVPNGQIGVTFQQLLAQDALAIPFQIKFNVTFHGGGAPYFLDSTFVLGQSTLA